MIQDLLKEPFSLLFIAFSFIFLFLLLNGLQEVSLGENEQVTNTLEEGKKSLNIILGGCFLALGITGTFGSIFLIYKLIDSW